MASLGVAATFTANPEPASAAATATARRPGNKRSPAFLCDDAVSYLYNPTKKSEIWIVGTAHISNSSATVRAGLIGVFVERGWSLRRGETYDRKPTATYVAHSWNVQFPSD